MKRFFILASAAIVALASCARTEVVYDEQPNEIAFRQITDVMTKAGETLSTDIALGVFAHQSANLYFDNTSFTHSEEVWAGGRYWPFDGSGLDFTVYAPYNANTGTTYDVNAKTLTINGVQAGEAQYYGSQRYLGTIQPTGNAAFPVVLKHISSKISVAVKGTPGVYKVTGLILEDPIKSGEVDVNYTTNEAPTVSVVADPAPTKEDVQFWSGASVQLSDAAVKSDVVAYVLPGEQTSFTITFEQYTNGIDEDEKLTFARTIELSDSWVANTQYLYTIEITADEIKLTATIAEWEPEQNVSLDNDNMTL